MNTKQNLKEKLQHLLKLAKSGTKDAYTSSLDILGEISYPFVAGYLQSRLESTIASAIQKILDEMEEE